MTFFLDRRYQLSYWGRVLIHCEAAVTVTVTAAEQQINFRESKHYEVINFTSFEATCF